MRLLLAVVLLFAPLGANAHGWYPTECCAEGHCHPVDCSEIKSHGTSYTWHEFNFLRTQMKLSPDGNCHVCYGHVPYCIFLGGIS